MLIVKMWAQHIYYWKQRNFVSNSIRSYDTTAVWWVAISAINTTTTTTTTSTTNAAAEYNNRDYYEIVLANPNSRLYSLCLLNLQRVPASRKAHRTQRDGVYSSYTRICAAYLLSRNSFSDTGKGTLQSVATSCPSGAPDISFAGIQLCGY
jgi:hypothetical protein